MKNDRPYDLAVVGVGNLLWADEGFGVRCVEDFHRRFEPPPRTRVLDGGTLGLWLLDCFTTTRDLLLFDCADLGAPPGTLKVLEREDFSLWSSTRLSPHQAGVNDVLTAAVLLGRLPERIAVVGAQPLVLDDYGGSLSAPLQALIAPAVEAAERVLARWGHPLRRRSPNEPIAALTAAGLEKTRYEAERPSIREACREGDVRFAVQVFKEKSSCASRCP